LAWILEGLLFSIPLYERLINTVFDNSGLVLLNVIDKISPGLFDWKKVNTKDPNKFKQVENCNLVVELGKKLNFSLVGIGGTGTVLL